MNEIVKYNGYEINLNPHDKMMCLTDMWRAQGSPANKGPADWLPSTQAVEFIDKLKYGKFPHLELVETKRGNQGGTWAHWQIGFAYAKYLSPEFHIFCNEQLYTLFTKGEVALRDSNVPDEYRIFAREVACEVGREITKAMVTWVQDEVNPKIIRLQNCFETHEQRIERIEKEQAKIPKRRKEAGRVAKRLHKKFREFWYHDKCPCCMNSSKYWEVEHWDGPDKYHKMNMWCVCRACNRGFNTGKRRPEDKYRMYLKYFDEWNDGQYRLFK